jgi:hypothetical protein
MNFIKFTVSVSEANWPALLKTDVKNNGTIDPEVSVPSGDFTPDSVVFNPTNMSYEDGYAIQSNTSHPGITGTDQPIDVRLVLTSGSGGTVYYRTSSSRINPNDYQTNPGAWSVLNFTLNQSATITINPSFQIGFAVDVIAAGATNTYQLRNLSDANTLLTTFTATRVAVSFDYGTFANPTGTNRDYIYNYNEDFGVVSGGVQNIVED